MDFIRDFTLTTNLTTPAIGRENWQNLCKPRGQEWTYLIKGYRGHVGVTDQARVYVTTFSLEISLKTQTEPDSDQAGNIEET